MKPHAAGLNRPGKSSLIAQLKKPLPALNSTAANIPLIDNSCAACDQLSFIG